MASNGERTIRQFLLGMILYREITILAHASSETCALDSIATKLHFVLHIVCDNPLVVHDVDSTDKSEVVFCEAEALAIAVLYGSDNLADDSKNLGLLEDVARYFRDSGVDTVHLV